LLAQSELLRAADAVPADRWKTRLAEEGRWPAGKLVGDVSAIERAILSRAGKLLGKTTGIRAVFQFFNWFHVPMMFVEARVIRRKAPVTLEPKVVREKEEMLAAECAECGADVGVHRKDQRRRPL